jgi:nucleotide-binding universal stress UspA family protein
MEADMIALKRILVATDFEPESQSAVQYGRALARSFGAALHLLHVTEDLLARPMDGYAYAGLSAAVQEEIECAARKETDDLLTDEDRRELCGVTATISSNDTAEAIVTYARDHAIDLVVLGTHGRGALAHLMMGNVAERVVRTASCPVLTVKHPEHEFVLPDARVEPAYA